MIRSEVTGMTKMRFRAAACLAAFIAVLLCVAGCNKGGGAEQVQEAFDQFLMEEFVEGVQSDSISLHYTLAQPEAYGIKDFKPTLGDYSEEMFREMIEDAGETLAALKGFDYKKLTEEQQITYDIMEWSLETSLAEEPYFLYEEAFSPTTGLQAQLPVLLAEYKFYDADDVREYLELLPCVYEYYEAILAVERQRAEAGLFLADRAVDDITSQCQDFIAEPEENFLITSFPARLEGIPGLNEDDRLALEYENKRAVLDSVIPAYELLIATLTELKGSGMNEMGLCYFPEGTGYYEWLVRNNTGSDWSISKMKNELDKAIQEALLRMQLAYQNDAGVLEQVESPQWPETEPEAILAYLKEAMAADYPAIGEASYSVKYVDPSMQDHLSPAFFLTPALDDWQNLSIYINESETNGALDSLFTTLAHEGFPGHLYESVRFNQTEPEPIRQLLSFSGYAEGWATYAEYSAYSYGGLSGALTDMLLYNQLAVLAICGRADIGVNYDGWDLQQTFEYLAGFGLAQEPEDAEGLYWSCIEEPANTLDYVIGYLEFAGLRREAEERLGDGFRAVDYHAALLDLGPAPFSVLAKWMDE